MIVINNVSGGAVIWKRLPLVSRKKKVPISSYAKVVFQ